MGPDLPHVSMRPAFMHQAVPPVGWLISHLPPLWTILADPILRESSPAGGREVALDLLRKSRVHLHALVCAVVCAPRRRGRSSTAPLHLGMGHA